jgi:Glucosidase II beta subunit-like
MGTADRVLLAQTTAHTMGHLESCRTGPFLAAVGHRGGSVGSAACTMRPSICGCVFALWSARCLAFTCKDGLQSIVDTKVEDNYCDCGDGSDETTTPACAGQNGARYCKNLLSMCDPSICCNLAYLYTRSLAVATSCYALPKEKYVYTPRNASDDTRSTFACTGDLPAELSIPMSRVWDGVCDCCDGADEPASSSCSNRCADRAKEQQADALQLFYRVHSSLSKKAEMAAAGAKLTAEWQAQAR